MALEIRVLYSAGLVVKGLIQAMMAASSACLAHKDGTRMISSRVLVDSALPVG